MYFVKGGCRMKENRIGMMINRYRKDKRLTQEQLAAMLGVTPGAVSKWENGASLPDITILRPLARALGITLDTLLCFEAELTDEGAAEIRRELTARFISEGYEAASAACRKYLAEYPNSTLLKLIAAQLLQTYIGTAETLSEPFLAEQYRYVLSLFEQVAASDELEYVSAALLAGASLKMMQGDYEAAEQDLKRMSSSHADPCALWPTLLLKQDKLAEAEMMSQSMLLRYLNLSAGMLNMLSKLAVKKDDEEKAHFFLAEAARLEAHFDIGLSSAEYGTAWLYLRSGKLEKAAEKILEYVKKLLKAPFDYEGNPYFGSLILQQGHEGQKAARHGLYRSIIEDEEWKVLAGMTDYQAAVALLYSALKD